MSNFKKETVYEEKQNWIRHVSGVTGFLRAVLEGRML